jgi:hypothetical protein
MALQRLDWYGQECDAPDGLVGDDNLGPLFGADDLDNGLQLFLDNGDGAAIFSLLVRSAHF